MMNSSSKFQRTQKTEDENIRTGRNHEKILEDAVKKLKDRIEVYKDTSKKLSDIVSSTKKTILTSYDEVQKEVQPTLENTQKMLLHDIEKQRIKNDDLQKEIIDIKKEKAQLVQDIITCKKKLDELQQDLGRYPGDNSNHSQTK